MKHILLIAIALLPVALLALGCAQQNVPTRPFERADFIGDGKTDNTAALQRAAAGRSKAGGGTVHFPRGNFLYAGHDNVPNGDTVAGLWTSLPAHNGRKR